MKCKFHRRSILLAEVDHTHQRVEEGKVYVLVEVKRVPFLSCMQPPRFLKNGWGGNKPVIKA